MSDVSKTLTVFTFQGHELRVIDHNGEPWFIGNEVCDALDIVNSRDALARLSPRQRDDVGIPDAIGRIQQTNIISEGGVYKLAFRSHKKEAEEFTDKVVNEILPSIRKTGSYSASPLQGEWDTSGIENDPRQLALAIRYERAKTNYLLAIRALRYPHLVIRQQEAKQLSAPKVDKDTPEYIQGQIVKHLSNHGPLTFNTLYHSYLRRYDEMTIRHHLVLLEQQGLVRKETTSHAVKFSISTSVDIA